MVDGANEEDGTGIEHDMEAMNDEEEVVYEEDDVIHPPIVSTFDKDKKFLRIETLLRAN